MLLSKASFCRVGGVLRRKPVLADRLAAGAQESYYSGLTREVSRENRRQGVTSIGFVIYAPKVVPLRRGNLKTLRKLPDLQR